MNDDDQEHSALPAQKLVVDKALKRAAKEAEFIHIGVYRKAGTFTAEFWKTPRNDPYHQSISARFDGNGSVVKNWGKEEYDDKVTVYIPTGYTQTLTNIIQMLPNGTEMSLKVGLHNDSDRLLEIGWTNHDLQLVAHKKTDEKRFVIFEQTEPKHSMVSDFRHHYHALGGY